MTNLRELREHPGTQARFMGNHRVHPVQKSSVGTGAPLRAKKGETR
jgi:hypothetical protein